MGDRPHSDRPHAESTHTVGGSGSSGPQGEPCDQLVSRQPDHVPRSAQTRRRARSGSLACQKAAARGRGALTPLRMPPGGVRLFRSLCLGASRTGQRRRPATHSEGGRPALAAESLIARRWPAVVTPGRAVQRAGDAAASHSAADGAGPSIEGARTYAHASSRGAALRFCAFRSADQGALSDTTGRIAGQLSLSWPRPIQLLQDPAFLWAIHIARARALSMCSFAFAGPFPC